MKISVEETERENVIQHYLEGYNTFDIPKMVAHFDEAIVFENVSNGEVNLKLEGLADFIKQAEQAKAYFTTRTQTVKSFKHQENQTEIILDYEAVLAVDLPNGLKKGEKLQLQGKSIFTFSSGKIAKLTDIS
ncbi:nuclear transport factor 2 family protein [Rufibacter latericius]|uniref:Nuclear transport factor 2 family protein n=1 Tax=Rufibacter latericius TaxID=2487040 RepID=A0A3M9N2V3_9BACT|nr:nuclear transport factor 2 family protein [Rufibacter latericius]RNI31348.1 nuclear transport factor 2 family protein [Rufibacter latericius]